MKVEKINDNGEEVRLRVTASAAEMEKAFTDGLDAFAAQYQLDQLEGDTALQKIQGAMDEEEAQGAIYTGVVNYLVPFAIEKHGAMPLSTYGIESEEAPEPDKKFTFEMTLLVKPDFELSSYEPAHCHIGPCPEVHEADIDQQVQMLVQEFVSMQPGENNELPEVTDEWVAANLAPMGLSTVEELRQRFRETSAEELAARYEQAKMAAAMEQYASRFTGEVSEKMLNAMTEELYETFLSQLAGDGMSAEQFFAAQGMTEEEVRGTLSAQAENQLLQGFILDAIFRHEKLQLTSSDLIISLKNIAPGHEEEAFESMQKTGRAFLLKEAAGRMKAAQWILENTEFHVVEDQCVCGDHCHCH